MSKLVGTKAGVAYKNKLNRVRQIIANIPEYGQLDDAMLAAVYAEGDILVISGCAGLEKGAMKKEINHIRVLGESNGEYLVECNGRIGFTSKEKIYSALDIPVEESHKHDNENKNEKVESEEDR